ncbi:MAG: 2-hydroxyglutaryl-CoA dehydratase [Provencibacterium sp.]|jgi:predicted nucleotide-binding protein (sugar kinase/HSP70/actin superfamily)|nr:2-hydroxyglutaryl-CoA dehydratase [Provencibacterium sp.]
MENKCLPLEYGPRKVEFTPEMKATHTILVPMMLPIHFEMLCEIFRQEGYKVDLLRTNHRGIVEEGLKNVHNDTCYPALLVIGQMMDALKSGNYDLDKVALLITQTGGGCRASNYLSLLRKALYNAGMGQIPIVSLNFSGLEKNSGFTISPRALVKIAFALTYGDMLMWIANQCRTYEKIPGQTQETVERWTRTLTRQFQSLRFFFVKRNYRAILKDFAAIERIEKPRIPVGIVGEIYMKYAALGNNSLEEFLISQGAEPVVSGVTDFVLYCIRNNVFDKRLYGTNKRAGITWAVAGGYLLSRQKQIIRAIEEEGSFQPPTLFTELEKLVEGTIGTGAKMGEGWLLTSEMLELIHSGVGNIVCTQPFGCLPNHIVAKGMIRKIREAHPEANIVAVDYDPGATRINQENRIKLMLANAFRNAGAIPNEEEAQPAAVPEPHEQADFLPTAPAAQQG